MTKEEIISKVRYLNLPQGSYVVFGSCPLAAVGLREANDIDLFVSEKIYKRLKKEGWLLVRKGPNDTPLTRDVFEAHDNWNFSLYSPTLSDLLKRAIAIEGISFASIYDVRRWKAASGRPKDLADIKLIDQYLEIS